MSLFYSVAVPFLAGLCVLAYQVLFWLKQGAWRPISIFEAFFNFLPANFLKWVFDPTDWSDLSEVAKFIVLSPAGLVLIALGVLLAYPLMYLSVAISHASDMLALPTTTQDEAPET